MDAARRPQAWEEHYSALFKNHGFKRLKSVLVAFVHENHGFVRGDDFVWEGIVQLRFWRCVFHKSGRQNGSTLGRFLKGFDKALVGEPGKNQVRCLGATEKCYFMVIKLSLTAMSGFDGAVHGH